MLRRLATVRRPQWLRLDLFAALDRLRDLFTAPAEVRDDVRRTRAVLEVDPMGWRNPPSETITAVALPLAASAAAAAAAVYFASALAAADDRAVAEGVADPGAAAGGPGAAAGGGFDATPGTVGPVGLPGDSEPFYPAAASAADQGARDAIESESDGPAMFVSADLGGSADLLGSGAGGGGGGGGLWDTGADSAAAVGGAMPWGESGTNTPAVPTWSPAAGVTGGTTVGGGIVAPAVAAPSVTGASVYIPASGSVGPPAASGTGGPGTTPGGSTGSGGSGTVPGGPTGSGGSGTPGTDPGAGPAAGTDIAARAAAQGLRFVANAGQWDSAVDFRVAGAGSQTWVAGDQVVFAVPRSVDTGGTAAMRNIAPGEGAAVPSVAYDAIRVSWAGMNPDAVAVGEGRLDSVSNFLLGNDPTKWRTNVPEYAGVRYTGAWAGADLVYRRAAGGGLEYDVVVAPGADPSVAGFAVDGAAATVVDGQLVLTTPGGGRVVQDAPVLYQVAADGTRELVAGAFDLRADGRVGFAVGAYDAARELIIDPVVSASFVTTAPGGGTGIATDSAGNAYLVGETNSSSFPTTTGAYDPTFNGASDAFVVKLDPMGNIVWSTFLGGAAGTDYDDARSVAVGPDGNLFVIGNTNSTSFPVTTGAYRTTPESSEVFLTKLSADGTAIVYSTYFGGESGDRALGVAVDQATGEAVVVGSTAGLNGGTDFPAVNAYQAARAGGNDPFVARFNANGTGLIFSTLLGGTGYSDAASAVALDAYGNAFVVGETEDLDFPTLNASDATANGSIDAFLAKFSPTGTLLVSTYYGGAGADQPHGVAVGPDGGVYVTGSVSWTSGFLTKFSSFSAPPVYTTTTPGDSGEGVVVDRSNRPLVIGNSSGSLWAGRYNVAGSALDWTVTWSSSYGIGYWHGAALDPEENLWASGGITYPSVHAVAVKIGPPVAPVLTSISDDTGYSAADAVTNDTTPTVTGTSYAGAVVSVYRRRLTDSLPVLVGTTTADVYTGVWSVADGTVPADGRYAYTATATVGGDTSGSSAPVTMTLDTVAPVVSVVALAGTVTYDLTPDLLVRATDQVGLPPTGTAILDVDLNNDGDFSDPGETGYAATAFAGGVARFDGYAGLAVGNTYRFRARVPDLAGNVGASPPVTVQVATSPTNWPAAPLTASTRSAYGVTSINSLLAVGDVTAVQKIDLDVSHNTCGCSDELVYHSQEAAPAPVVQAVVQSDSAAGVPTQVTVTLTWDGVTVGTETYDGTDLGGLSPGGAWVFGMAPTSGLGTGRHLYTITLDFEFGGADPVTRSVSGQTFVVNRADSPYGAGWSFANVDTLVNVPASGGYPAGVLRLHGGGGWAFYESAGGSAYSSPVGDAGTLVALGGGGWTHTGSNGMIRTFDALGRMTSTYYPSTRGTLTYAYDGSAAGTAARLASVTSPDLAVAEFAYAGGLLASVSAPGGRTTTFSHSGTDLVTIQGPDDSYHTFTYDSHRLTCDALGTAKLSYAYDTHGLAASYTLGADPLVAPAAAVGLAAPATASPGNGVPAALTDALGRTWYTWYDSLGQPVRTIDPLGAVEEYDRDGNGYVTRYVDPLGNATTYAVDAAGLVLGETRPDGTNAAWEYAGANGSLTRYVDYRGGVYTYTNDADGNRLTATDPLARTTTYTYDDGLLETVTDPLGNVTTYLYDASRRQIGALVGGSVTGTVGYDAAGNRATVTDPLGNVTTSVYDGAGRVVAVVDPLGHVTSYAYDPSGVLRSTTDPLGHVTSYAYDAAGRQTARIDANGTALERRATSVYDAAGQLVATVDPLGNVTTSVYDRAGRVIAVVDPLGNRTDYTYDLAGHLVAVTDALGRVTAIHYDLLGRADAVTDPLGNVTTAVYDANSNPVATVDALGRRASSVYDAADQLVARVDPLGNVTSYGYDAAGRAVSVTDPLNHTATTTYDTRDRVRTTVDPLGNVTSFAYDAADRLVAVTDPRGNTTTTAYDAAGRTIATTDALGKVWTTTYDAAGRAVSRTDPLNHTATTVYDALDRAVASVDALGRAVTSVYDAADRLVAVVDSLGNRSTAVYDALGRLVAAVDALGNRTSYGYDAVDNAITRTDPLGRVTTSVYDALDRRVTSVDALGNRATTTFDAVGRVVAATDPLGRITSFAYDAADRLVATTDAIGKVWTTTYDAAGQAVAATDPLGRITSTAYDALGRAVATTDALGNVWTTTYDATGNVTASVNPLGNRTTAVYDALDRRVATVDALGNRATVAYDAAGRLLAVTDSRNFTTSYGYDAADRRITTTDSLGKVWTVAYDAAGRATSATDPLNRTTTTVYDAAGQVVATVDGAGKTWTTVYDAAGNVTANVNPLGNRTTAVFDALDRRVATVDALGNRSTAVYDAAGNVVVTVDPLGRRTTAAYDALDRVAATTDALGNVWTTQYDAVGNAVAATDPLGRVTTSVYDALDRAVATVDALGNRATVAYDAAGRVVTSTDPLNRTTSYGYDAADRRTTTTDALGNVWTTTYDATGNAVSRTDPLNHTGTTVFDALNRAIATVDALGNRSTTVYDAAGQVSAVTDPLNRTTSYGYNARGLRNTITDAAGKVWTTVYDDAGQAVSRTDPLNHTTSTAYDAAGRAVATVDALGNRSTTAYDAVGNAVTRTDPLGRVTTSVYDALDRRVATVDALGNRSTTTFDAVGNAVVQIDALNRRTTAAYDALDRLVTVTDALGGVSTTGYDAAGNAVTVTNPLGRVTSFAYDALDRAVARTDALGNVWTTTYDAAGRAVAATDPLGRTVTTVYDAADRAVASVDPLGNATTTVYDAAGQVVARVDALGNRTTTGYDARGLVVTVKNPLGNTTTVGYDAAGNAVTRTTPLGFTTTTAYDAADRPIAVTDALGKVWTTTYDAVGNAVTRVDPLGYATTTVYDALDRVVATVSPLGNRTTTVYDAVGHAVAAIDGLGKRTTTVYDSLDRAVAVVDPRAGVTTSVYDAAGNRTALVDPAGNRTTWTYDALNRPVAEANPLNAVATTAYDAVGRIASTTDRLGRRTDHAYDAAGRHATEKWYATGGALVQTQTWTYDAAGQLLTAQDPDGAYTLTYDAAGRVVQVVNPNNVQLTFAYDANGNRTSVRDSRQGVTTVTFDALDRQVFESAGSPFVAAVAVRHAYTARGEVASVTRYTDAAGTSVATTLAYSYDADGRTTNVKTRRANNAIVANYTYTYDAADRVTSKVENGTTTSFAYDTADQLTQAGTATYGYDANGNRTNTGYVTTAGNRTTRDGTWTYTYDANGNVVKKSKGAAAETWVYTYDHNNQEVAVVQSATDGGAATQRSTFSYDAFGNLIRRQQWNGTTVSERRLGIDAWDPAKPPAVGTEDSDVWIELDATNAVAVRRVHGPGVNEVLARQVQSGAATGYVVDAQGSLRGLTDATGAVLNTVVYDAYGRTTSGDLGDAYGYHAMYRDIISGDYLDRARTYSPQLGRFYQTDPIGFAAGDANLFRFAGNSPTNATDPSGMQPPANRRLTTQELLLNEQARRYPELKARLEAMSKNPASNVEKNVSGNYQYKPSRELAEAVAGDKHKNDVERIMIAEGKSESEAEQILASRERVRKAEQAADDLKDLRRKEQITTNETEYAYRMAYLNKKAAAEQDKVEREAAFERERAAGGFFSLASKMARNDLRNTENEIQDRFEDMSLAALFGGPIGLGIVQNFHLTNDLVNIAKATAEGIADLPDNLKAIENGFATNPSATAGAVTYETAKGLLMLFGPKLLLGKAKVPLAKEPIPVKPSGGIPERACASPPGATPVNGLLKSISDAVRGTFCFAAGTPLLTPDGSKLIENFTAGDVVLSRDEHNPDGEIVSKVVEEVFRRSARTLAVRVGNQTIRTTTEHPFWVRGKGWLAASQLIPGDGLLSHDGQWVVVSEVVDTGDWEVVYNMRVADSHTYFVGCDEWGFSVWAHNSNACVTKIGSVSEAEIAKLPVEQQKIVRAEQKLLETGKEMGKDVYGVTKDGKTTYHFGKDTADAHAAKLNTPKPDPVFEMGQPLTKGQWEIPRNDVERGVLGRARANAGVRSRTNDRIIPKEEISGELYARTGNYEKWSYVETVDGVRYEVHYMRNVETGATGHFKFVPIK